MNSYSKGRRNNSIQLHQILWFTLLPPHLPGSSWDQKENRQAARRLWSSLPSLQKNVFKADFPSVEKVSNCTSHMLANTIFMSANSKVRTPWLLRGTIKLKDTIWKWVYCVLILSRSPLMRHSPEDVAWRKPAVPCHTFLQLDSALFTALGCQGWVRSKKQTMEGDGSWVSLVVCQCGIPVFHKSQTKHYNKIKNAENILCSLSHKITSWTRVDFFKNSKSVVKVLQGQQDTWHEKCNDLHHMLI